MQNVSRRAAGGRPRSPAGSRAGAPPRPSAPLAGLALLLSFRTPDALPLTGLGAGDLGGLVPVSERPSRDRPAAHRRHRGRPQADADADPDRGRHPERGDCRLADAPQPTDTPARPTPAPAEQVVDGKVVNTRYGPVQVEVTLSGSKIVDVQALQLPNDRQYSAEISDYVAPYLRQMALQAQSANIDIISGATYTSTGYARSLQSALNAAQ